MQQEDIKDIKLNKQDIFARQKLNTNDFGKIFIMSDGKEYANVNIEPVGNIEEEIDNILCRELVNGDSWRYTRYNVKPCSQCHFNLICPSPSSYELVIGKPNLCNVVQ